MVMQCPFFKREGYLKLYCEGGTIKFPDSQSRCDYVGKYCANSFNWHKCTVAHNLENYYERKDEEKWTLERR